MGLDDFLFGEGGGIEKIDLLDPKQAELWDMFFNALITGEGLGLTGGPLFYEGKLPKGMQRFMRLAREGFGGALGAFQDVISRGPEDFEEFYRSTIEAPLMERFQEDILPGISRGYAPSGFYSSQRLDADQRAQEELIEALATGRAATGYQARENWLSRMLGAAQGLTGLGTQATQAGLGIGGFRAGMGGELQRRQENQANMMLAALGLNRYGLAVDPGSSGMLSQLIGAAGAGMGYGLGQGAWGFDWKKLFGGGGRGGGTWNPWMDWEV